jgi:hypothetical protein
MEPGRMGKAVDFKIYSTSLWVKLGFFCSIRATTAEMCGVAILVPPK